MIIFEYNRIRKSKFSYQYLTELQSHLKDFDFLKSQDIEEKINQIQWLPSQGSNMYILSTNDKTIKLWKISEKYVKKVVPDPTNDDSEISFPELVCGPKTFMPKLRK